MTFGKQVSHGEILDAREKRMMKQKVFISQFKDFEQRTLSLVTFTVNMPGHFKHSPLAIGLHEKGDLALRELMNKKQLVIVKDELLDRLTGNEGYYLINCRGKVLKALMIELEESQKLGRLWDFDVFDSSGVQISRDAIKAPKRICLLCDKEAHVCSRSRAHTYQALLEYMQLMYDFETNMVQDK